MPNPKAKATGNRLGPPIEVVVSVDGAPVGVVFSLSIVDPTTTEGPLPFGPSSPLESQVDRRYTVPAPAWWLDGKVIRCQVDGEPGPWTQNRVRLAAYQAGERLEELAWDVIQENDPDGIPLRLSLRMV